MSTVPSWLPEIFEGTDVSLTICQRPTPATGIDGQTFQFSLRRSFNDPSPLILKTMGAGVTILDGANAAIGVTLVPADTAAGTGCGPGLYLWSLRRVDAGFASVVACGKVWVRPNIAIAPIPPAIAGWSDELGDGSLWDFVPGGIPPIAPVEA